jgi:hypothetical protein
VSRHWFTESLRDHLDPIKPSLSLAMGLTTIWVSPPKYVEV